MREIMQAYYFFESLTGRDILEGLGVERRIMIKLI
jgi:hypothetical protein